MTRKMKKTIIMALCMGALSISPIAVRGVDAAMTFTQNKDSYAEISFDTLTIDLGTFSEKDPVQKCTFNFTNEGTAPLVIHQAFASCGCTVPKYTKTPIKPGCKGKIDVTYNGQGKFEGKFQKTITVRSNAKNNVVRLTIKGHMTK